MASMNDVLTRLQRDRLWAEVENAIPRCAESNDVDRASSSGSVISNAPRFGRVIPNRVFVGGIDIKTTEDELLRHLSSFGQIVNVKIIRDRAHVSKGFGFVTFERVEDAINLKSHDDAIVLRGKKLNIGPAIEKSQTSLPKDVHLPTPPGSVVVHPEGYVSCTDYNGITYFSPSNPDLTIAATLRQQMVLPMEVHRPVAPENSLATGFDLFPGNNSPFAPVLPRHYAHALRPVRSSVTCNIPRLPHHSPKRRLMQRPAAVVPFMPPPALPADKTAIFLEEAGFQNLAGQPNNYACPPAAQRPAIQGPPPHTIGFPGNYPAHDAFPRALRPGVHQNSPNVSHAVAQRASNPPAIPPPPFAPFYFNPVLYFMAPQGATQSEHIPTPPPPGVYCANPRIAYAMAPPGLQHPQQIPSPPSERQCFNGPPLSCAMAPQGLQLQSQISPPPSLPPALLGNSQSSSPIFVPVPPPPHVQHPAMSYQYHPQAAPVNAGFVSENIVNPAMEPMPGHQCNEDPSMMTPPKTPEHLSQ